MFWARPVVMLVNEVFSKASVFGETTLDENLFDTGLSKGKRECRAIRWRVVVNIKIIHTDKVHNGKLPVVRDEGGAIEETMVTAIDILLSRREAGVFGISEGI